MVANRWLTGPTLRPAGGHGPRPPRTASEAEGDPRVPPRTRHDRAPPNDRSPMRTSNPGTDRHGLPVVEPQSPQMPIGRRGGVTKQRCATGRRSPGVETTRSRCREVEVTAPPRGLVRSQQPRLGAPRSASGCRQRCSGSGPRDRAPHVALRHEEVDERVGVESGIRVPRSRGQVVFPRTA